MGGTVRETPGSDPGSQWVVRGQRHAEGGGAALTMQVRPDGLLALLVAGGGRGTMLLGVEATDRLAHAARRALGAQLEVALAGNDVAVARVSAAIEDGTRWHRTTRGTRTPAPAVPRGRGPERIGRRVIVSAVAHAMVCGFAPTLTRLDADPSVMPCAGCDLGVRVDAASGGAA